MLNKASAGIELRRLYKPGFLFLIIFTVVACRGGKPKNPTHLVFTTTPLPASTVQPVVRGALKIGVNLEGLYEVTSTDIQNLLPEWKNVDPDHLRLTLLGEEHPIWISTQGETFKVRFYGIPSNSRYTGENFYILERNDIESALMSEKQLPDGNSTPSESTIATAHFEENNIYAPQVLDGDHLFWVSLAGRKKQDFEVNLPKVVNGGGHLRLAVWGSTQSPEEFDHHLMISLNGEKLVDEKWDGAGRRTLEADIPAGLLKDGKNLVMVDAPGDTGAAAEINDVDWIELNYSRVAEADSDFLAIEAASEPLHLTKFSGSVSVLDVTVPTDTVRIVGIRGDKEIVFSPENDHRYLAVGPKGFSRPADLTPAVLSPDLHAPGIGADYVMIAPQEFIPALGPLIDWRVSHGLKVVSVPLDAVYDQFNGGMPDPEAIRTFMSYAAKSWQPAPRYLLLVGDATYDPRGYISPPEANRLPVLFIQTSYGGETASDVLLGDVDGDMLPDLAVGRLPAQNTDQVRILVKKILAYEQNAVPDDWRMRVLAIADGQDMNFKRDAQAFLALVGAPYTQTLFTPEAGVKDASAKVKAYFDEGYGLIAYFGHGSINMWGKDRIFMAEDVANLSNPDRLPIVINMTCLTGLFIHPKVTSLTETLLWYENGGVVAMLAPTSLTLPDNQSFLSQAFIQSWMQNPNATLGDNFLQAQRTVPVNDPGAREVLLTFLLFGDPALRMGP